jgi:cyclophilin family peptidyl-prolyl cis-trans isomerase
MKLLFAALTLLGVLQQPVSLQQLRQAAQPAGAEPIDVLLLEKEWAGAESLFRLVNDRQTDTATRNAAIRAIGRLEDPRNVPLLAALQSKIDAGTLASSIAQSFNGFDPAVDPGLVRTATEWMFRLAEQPVSNTDVMRIVATVSGPLAGIAYPSADEVHRVEQILVKVAKFTAADPRLRGVYQANAAHFEALARKNQRTTAVQDETADYLKKVVTHDFANDTDDVRFHAFMALTSGRALDAATVKVGLKDGYWQVRRAAAAVVAGAGGGLDDEARLDAIDALLGDKEPHVRYEGLRGYVRRSARTKGCGPILDAINDTDPSIALAALDALGDLCKEDDAVTARLAAEARVPPASNAWHRETHAFVSLAKRSPERAAPSMEAFVTHPNWWVRMYAAGAAAVAGDLLHLEKLVYDTNDNVREAALGPWRRLKKAEAVPGILDALTRSDVQLLRTAATMMKEVPRTDETYRVLMAALKRLTAEGKETSRDARLPLLEAIALHATINNADDLLPLLKDFDPKIAEKTAQVLISLTGKVALPASVPYRRGWTQEFQDLRQCVVVQLSSGSFRMRMLPNGAPVTVDRFLKLATKDHYYDGLTIHRVVPNFVIQGGSPNANEYSGAKEYMRDEIALGNARGSVGLSTRGRNTADAQFFVNLVDNPRLNPDYTVFARVLDADMDVVDRIQEGEVMRSIAVTGCGTGR